jgi:hypothetical protein
MPPLRERTMLYAWERKAMWVLLGGCFGMKLVDGMIQLARASGIMP